MKNFALLTFLLFSVSAFSDIEDMPGNHTEPTAAEISASRSCFDEVIQAGCAHPKENQTEFRACMSSVHSSLSSECQKMMTRLYGK